MKRIALCLAVVTVLAACPKSSEASDLTRIVRIAIGADHHSHRYAAQQAYFDRQAAWQARALEREYVRQAAYQRAYAPPVPAPGVYAPQALPPQYIQGYPNVPSGYGNPYGAYQYQPAPLDHRAGCSPYGRY